MSSAEAQMVCGVVLGGATRPIVRVSALAVHVAHVVAVSSEPKVAGVHAERVVAAMKNMKLLREDAAKKLIRNPCSGGLLPAYGHHCPRPVAHGAEPYPAAAVRLRDVLGFKAFDDLGHVCFPLLR